MKGNKIQCLQDRCRSVHHSHRTQGLFKFVFSVRAKGKEGGGGGGGKGNVHIASDAADIKISNFHEIIIFFDQITDFTKFFNNAKIYS